MLFSVSGRHGLRSTHLGGRGEGTLLASFLAATAAAETKLPIHFVIKIPVKPWASHAEHTSSLHTPKSSSVD